MKVTLVPSTWARKDERFVFFGATPECEECKLTKACLSLEPGMYKVMSVRKMEHVCPGPFDDKVNVAEVEEAPWDMALAPGPGTLGGATFSLRMDTHHGECDLAECPNFDLCHPPGLANRDRITIQVIEGKLDCPLGYVLKQAKVTKAPL